MKLALYSDLHLEIAAWQPPPLDVDLVILAGDIGSHTHGIEWAGQAFRQAPVSPDIVYVAGNHEYYDTHLGLLPELEKAGKKHGVHFLEKRAIELPGVRILGCTLWTAFDLYGVDAIEICMRICKNRINDFWSIDVRQGKRLDPNDVRRLHRAAAAWLGAELSKPFDGKTIVVTHFSPHPGTIAPQHQDGDVTSYFVTDLSGLMQKYLIDLWCFGHSHANANFIAENGCHVVSNQRGYPGEVAGNGFREDWMVEL